MQNETFTGLSQQRTVRVLGIASIVFGIIFLTLGFVLIYFDDFTSQVVNLAMARYSNFTGKFALNNFAEDKQLMAILVSVKDTLLPLIETAKPLAFLVGIFTSALGIAAEFFPTQIAALLLKMHILALEKENESPENAVDFRRRFKKLSFIAVVLLVVLLLFALIVHYADSSRDTPQKVAALEREAAQVVRLQREYFKKTKTLGTWKLIGYEPSFSDVFRFEKRGKFSWQARVTSAWENCPDSSSWKVSFEITGFFEKELKVYASSPKNPDCAKLTPDFRKNIVR